MDINNELLNEIIKDDGSYRDIYIHQIDLGDWEKLLLLTTQSGWKVKFLKDNEEADLKHFSAEKIFQMKKDVCFLLSINLEGIIINCHFFDENEIELDFTPSQIHTLDQTHAIFEFIRILSKFFNKNVFLAPENFIESPYLSISPNGQIETYL